jgi:hypothetical protein
MYLRFFLFIHFFSYLFTRPFTDSFDRYIFYALIHLGLRAYLLAYVGYIGLLPFHYTHAGGDP